MRPFLVCHWHWHLQAALAQKNELMDAAIAHKNGKLETQTVALYGLQQERAEQDKVMRDQQQQVLFHQQQVYAILTINASFSDTAMAIEEKHQSD